MPADPIRPALVARVWLHVTGRSLLHDLNSRPDLVAAVFGRALAEARHIQRLHRANARLAALRAGREGDGDAG